MRMSGPNQATQHQTTHRSIDDGFARLAESFVLLTQPPALAEPTEGALPHPAPGQHAPELPRCPRQAFPDEPDRLQQVEVAMRDPFAARDRRVADDLDAPPQFAFDP